MTTQTKLNGEARKYWLKELEDGTYQIMRYDCPRAGLIHNMELQFWQEIQALEEEVIALKARNADLEEWLGDAQEDASSLRSQL